MSGQAQKEIPYPPVPESLGALETVSRLLPHSLLDLMAPEEQSEGRSERASGSSRRKGRRRRGGGGRGAGKHPDNCQEQKERRGGGNLGGKESPVLPS